MRIKTSLPAFTYIKLSDKKYAFVDQEGYIKMRAEDFLMFYRSVIPYTEYVEEVDPEYYERLASILPKNKIVTNIVEEKVERNDTLESVQAVEEGTDKTEQPSSSGDEKPERNRRKKGSN
ncbi:MAG: hypothetical protein QXF12_04035 [Candidatus Aenigmatarchaeota archaeon]